MDESVAQKDEKLVAGKLLELVYRRFSLTFWSTLLVSGGVVAALWGKVKPEVLLAWMLSLWLVAGTRQFYARRYLSLGLDNVDRQEKWLAGMVLGAVAGGASWGSSVYLFPAHPNDVITMLLLFVIAGVAGFACVTMAAVPAAAMVFMLFALMQPAFWLFSFGEREYFFMGGVTLVYLALMMVYVRQMHLVIRNSLTTTEQNKELSAALAEVKSLKYAVAQKESEQRYRQLFANFEDSIVFIDVDADGKFSVDSVNPAAERALGIRDADMRGKSKFDLFPADLAARLVEHDKACVESGRPQSYEEVLEQPAGKRYFSVTQIPMRDESGRVYRIAAIARDITERKQMEEALAVREREFRTLAENSPDPIFRYDRECRRVFANQMVVRTSGIPLEKLLGQTPTGSALVPSPESVKAQQSIQRVLDSGVADEIEVLFVAPDGREMYFQNIHVPEFAADGSVQSVLSMGRDVTARKYMESVLLKSEREYRMLAENSPDNIVRFDRELRVRYLNKNLESAVGMPAGYLLGKPLAEVFADGIFDELEVTLKKVAESGQSRDHYQAMPDTGKGERFLHLRIAAERDEHGAVSGILVIGRDITERKRMEEELGMKGHVLDHSSEAIFLIGEQGRFVYVNEQACRSLGYSREELLTMSTPDIDPNFKKEWLHYRSDKLRAAGGVFLFETTHQRRDGSIFPVEIQVSELEYEGRLLGVTQVRDITEIKRAQLALQNREREFRSLAGNIPDNIARWDTQGRYLYVNPTHERVLGSKLEDLIGQPIPASHENVKAAVAQVVATGQAIHAVRQPAIVNGVEELHDVSLVPEFDETGKIVSVLGIGRDMTDVYRMQEAIAAREQEFRSLAESSPDFIIRYDRAGRIRYLNTSLMRQLALESTTGVVGKRPAEAWPDGRFEQFERAAALAVETGDIQSFEMTIPGENAQLNYGKVSVVPERDMNGNIIGTIAFGRDVTDLRATERLMQMIGDHMPGALTHYRLRADLSGELLYASRGLKELYGITREELADGLAPMITRIHPDDLPKAVAEQEHAAKTLTTAVSEFRVNHPEKGEVWVQQITTPLPESDGSMLWYSLMFDISARKRMEASLRESRDFLRHIMDGISDPIFVKDRQHRWIEFNEAFCNMVGQPRAAMLGKSDYDFLPKEQADVFWDMDELVFNSGTANVNEESFTGADGELRHIQTKKMLAHFEGDGNDLLIGVIRDMTERKRMEDALAERQAFLDSLFEAIPVPVFYKDRAGRYLGFNRAYETVFGASREQLVGKSVFDTHPRELAETYHAKDAEIFERRVALQQYEFQIRHSDGTLRDVLFSKAAFTDARGEIDGLIGAVIDITERKRMEEALRQSEQLTRTVIDATPDWIFIKDQEHRYRLVNKGYAAALHLTPEDFIGKNDLDLGFPEELVKGNPEKGIRGFWADDRLVMDSNETQIYPDDPATIDGKVHTFHTIKVPLRNSGGMPWGVLAFARDISDRKQAERQLKETLEFSEGVINAIPDLLFEVDREGRYLNIWAQNPELLAAQRELLLGNTINEMLPPDAAAISMAAIREAEEKGLSLGKIICLALPHGQSWFELSISRKAGGATSDMHFLVLSRDITGRKLAEEALRESGEKLRSLFELSPLGIALTDMQGRYVEFNESFRSICGYPADELMTLDYWKLTPRSYEMQEIAQLESLAKTGRYGPYEKEYMQKDGTLVPIQLVGTLITGRDGTQHIWSIVEDIRERKRTEAELKERLDRIVELNDHLERTARDLEDQTVELEAQTVELEASQEQIKQTEVWYRSILHSAPDGMLVVDERGSIMLVNERLEAMFGYGRGELQGLAVEVLIPYASRERHVGLRNEFIAKDGAYRQAAKTLFGCRKDGTEFPVDVSLSRLPEVDGMRSAICASVRDISERHAMEAAREAALAEMQHLAQLRSTFMAQMSHELRTPLNGILGYAQNLLQGEALGEKQSAGLQIIQNSGEHLLTLINGILDHAAIEADKFELIPSDIELEPFLSTIIGIIRVRAEQKNLAFVCDADAGLPAVVRGDAQRLRQILLNLLSNAVKFTDHGQVTLRVTCSAPSRMRFAVQDSGVGIAPDQLETIFIPFEQGGEVSRRAGGTGLGLSISRKLVKLMGGDIRVESQPGAGCTFSFEIDMVSVQSGAEKVNATALSEQAVTRVVQATAQLLAPPKAELEVLYGSALRGNMREVIKHADRLVAQDSLYLPFAEQLRQLAKGFQTKALLGLIEQYRGEAGGGQ